MPRMSDSSAPFRPAQSRPAAPGIERAGARGRGRDLGPGKMERSEQAREETCSCDYRTMATAVRMAAVMDDLTYTARAWRRTCRISPVSLIVSGPLSMSR